MVHTSSADRARRVGRKRRRFWLAVLYHAGVGAFGLLMLYPVLWLFAGSLKGPDEIWTHVSSLIPEAWRFADFADGWRGFGGITFATFYKNSFIYAGGSTLISVTASALVARGLSVAGLLFLAAVNLYLWPSLETGAPLRALWRRAALLVLIRPLPSLLTLAACGLLAAAGLLLPRTAWMFFAVACAAFVSCWGVHRVVGRLEDDPRFAAAAWLHAGARGGGLPERLRGPR